MSYELKPRYDARQSFYNKAYVIEEQTEKGSLYSLKSYNTIVGTVEMLPNKNIYNYFGKYSQTTTRHQKEFFKQFGLNDRELKELFKNNTLEKEG